MLITKLLVLFGVVTAEVYFDLDSERVVFELPPVEDLMFRELAETMERAKIPLTALDKMHFDAASSALEILCLPEVFFEQYLQPAQLTELILNPVMENVLEGNYLQKEGRTIKARDATKRKIHHIYTQLEFLTPEQLGPQHDAVIARIPTKLYRFLSPITAVLARTVQTTFSAFFNLFSLSLRTCVRVGRATAHALMRAFRTLRDLGITPLRVFKYLEVLLSLLTAAPGLNGMAPRVFELATELEHLTGLMVQGLTSVGPLLSADPTDASNDFKSLHRPTPRRLLP